VKNRQQLLVIIAIAIAVLYIGDKLILPPITKHWDDRKKAIAKLREDIKGGQDLVNNEQNLHRRWNYMATNTLPIDTADAVQQVYNAIQLWGEKAGRRYINVSGVTPQWKHDEENGYSTLECRIEATGTLTGITQFLYEIETDPMALKVELVELNSRDETGSQFTLGLQLSGLVLGQAQPGSVPASAPQTASARVEE
jgi:hypothetical protein